MALHVRDFVCLFVCFFFFWTGCFCLFAYLFLLFAFFFSPKSLLTTRQLSSNSSFHFFFFAASTRSLTDLKIMHSGASMQGPTPPSSSVSTWAATETTNTGPYVQMYRGAGDYDTKTMKNYDDSNVAKSYFGDYSVAHVDCGLMACPTSNLQICSRIICPSGTKLDDSGNCVLCPTSAAGNTFSSRTMNPYQSAYYAVDTITCDACNDFELNYAGGTSVDRSVTPATPPSLAAVIKYNQGSVVKGPEWLNDPNKRTSCNVNSCSTGSFRSLITKNVGECTICG